MSVPATVQAAFAEGDRVEKRLPATRPPVDWEARFNDQCNRIANGLNDLAKHPDPMVSAWVALQVADTIERLSEKVFR